MDISLLKRLTMAPGISGREGAVRDIVEEILGGLTAEVSTDAMGSFIARVPGEGPKLLIDAHMDEVGLMVQHVDELGFIDALSRIYFYLINAKIYLIAGNKMHTTNINLISLAGTYFCNLAPQYMPANPPIPNRKPKAQSGAMAMSG